MRGLYIQNTHAACGPRLPPRNEAPAEERLSALDLRMRHHTFRLSQLRADDFYSESSVAFNNFNQSTKMIVQNTFQKYPSSSVMIQVLTMIFIIFHFYRIKLNGISTRTHAPLSENFARIFIQNSIKKP